MSPTEFALQALRIELRQLTANYRLPYAYQRRLTYPLPPYSTVLGFLRNLIGNHDRIKLGVKKAGLANNGEPSATEILPIDYIAIAGRFQSKSVEYTWLRTLAAKNDNYRRWEIYGFPQHPGEQRPVQIDALEQVELIIYLGVEESDLVETLQEAILNPFPSEIPHIGRAEDFVILEAVSPVELRWGKVPPKRYPYSFWVPYEEAQKQNLEGLPYRIGLRAEHRLISRVPPRGRSESSKHTQGSLFPSSSSEGFMRRVWHNVPVLLWEGELPYSIRAYFDPEKEIPVFLQSTHV